MKAKTKFIIRLTIATSITTLIVCCFYNDAFASVSPDIVNQIVNKFYTKATSWGNSLQTYALRLFNICATLTVVMFGVKSVLHKNNISAVVGQFVMTLLFCGFILAVIHNYQEWSWNVVNGLKNIAGDLESSSVDADKPLEKGYEIATIIFQKASLLDVGEAIGFLISSLIIMIVFALMTAQIVFIKCEAVIVMNASMILLGLGGATIFKEYAINVMRYVLAVSFKLFVMQLVMGIGLGFIENETLTDAGFQGVFIIIGVAIVLLALVKSLPDAIAGVINGSHVSTGNALGQTVQTVAAGAMAAAGGAIGGAVGGAAGAWKTGSAVRDASKVAGESGATGLGKFTNMASTLHGAHQAANVESGRMSHSSRVAANVKSRLQEMKMSKMAQGFDDSGENGENK